MATGFYRIGANRRLPTSNYVWDALVAIENAALRLQIAAFQRRRKRPALTAFDRVFWITLRSLWPGWRGPFNYVQPFTVAHWHRDRFRRFWARLSQPHGRRGRPSTANAIRQLIERMTVANPLWRAPRIHGELKMLGVVISEHTVSRILRGFRPRPSQTWKTFLHNHVGQMVSIDFFTVSTITMRCCPRFHHRPALRIQLRDSANTVPAGCA